VDLKKGSIVENKFEILERIGAGGMGTVYKAQNLTLLRTVVLKVLTPSYNSSNALVRFQNEAKILGKLKHAGIAEVYDVGITQDGLAYISLEFIDGITLQSFIESKQQLPLSQLIQIFIEIADALSHAHQVGIIHRDIKPGNIMLVKTEEGFFAPVLLDFGIAKYDTKDDAEQRLTEKGSAIGSPLYMSPEQCQGQKITVSADQYSLGCVFFECLTGNPPFVGDTAFDTISMHISSAPPDPMKTSYTEISHDLNEDIIRMLAKEPEARFASMEELVGVLIEHREQAIEDERVKPVEEKVEYYNLKKFLSKGWLTAYAVSAVVIGAIFAQQLLGQKAELSPAEKPVPNPDIERMENENMSIKDGVHKFLVATDASMERLKDRTDFLSVDLQSTGITDEGIKGLFGSKRKLTILNLVDTDVKTLKYIPEFTNLEWLLISQTDVEDKSFEKLAQMPRLHILELKNCDKITNGIFRYLVKYPQLHLVNVENTRITLADVKQIQKKMPNTVFPPLLFESPVSEPVKKAFEFILSNQNAKALPLLQKALDIIYSTRGSHSPEAAPIHTAMASVCIKLNRFREAKKHADLAVSLAREAHDDFELIRALTAQMQYATGVEKDARKGIAILREQRKIIDSIGQSETPIGRDNLYTLANVLSFQSEFDESEELFKECERIDLRDEKDVNLKAEQQASASLKVAYDLHGLGCVELRRGEKHAVKAEKLLRKALARIPRPTNNELAVLYSEASLHLAIALEHQKQYPEAIELLESACDVARAFCLTPQLEMYKQKLTESKDKARLQK
jgi:tetratricopeptide (TPR) repeat protein